VSPGKVFDAEKLQETVSSALIACVVLLTPATRHSVGCGEYDVPDAFLTTDALGETSADESDTRSQLEDVREANQLPEDLDFTRCGMQSRRRHTEQS
jgi:hypothetical protein